MAPSIWRRPGTRTFQLVHRSQRDPLINDPTASDRVLKAVDRGQKRDKDGASSYAPSEFGGEGEAVDDEEDRLAAAGDAAAYGILFDDADDYDYMQHLRSVGDAGESYLVEAPVQNKQAAKGKGKAPASSRGDGFELNPQARFEMPEDALPSHPLDELSYTEATTSRAVETGLRPDLDPSIREVLEALDDDAYAAEDGTGTDDEDEFWDGVLAGGEVEHLGLQEWEDAGVEQATKGVGKLAVGGEEEDEEEEEEGEGTWAAVKRFKAAQQAGGASDDEDEDEDDFASEGGDTIADLKAASARRPARKGAMSAVGSAFSMSSSAMFRNEQLRTLDDRFDQIEKLYDESDSDSWGGGSDDECGSDCESHAGGGGEYHGPPREDLESIMDEFLSRYEVFGGKMRPVLDPLDASTGAQGAEANASKLDRLRLELANLDLGEEVEGEDPEVTARRKEKERILAIVERQWKEETSKKKKERMPMINIVEDRYENKWDCETVLSTYSNLSNHPRMLRLRDSMGRKKTTGPVAQITIDPKTGFPLVDGKAVVDGRPNKKGEDTIMEEEEEDDEEEYEIRETVKRARDETNEDKKARKAAVKAERASRRAEKKSTKETFSNEVKRQKRAQGKRVAEGGAADIRSGQEGVKRLA